MAAKGRTPTIALIGALIFGFFCVYVAVDIFRNSQKTDEFGVSEVPGKGWSVLWISVAITILGLATVMTIRHLLRKR